VFVNVSTFSIETKELLMEYYLGQIQLFPYTFTPKNWASCEGQLLPIQQNAALFSLFGTTFGGDGQTTFALPDLRGKTPAPDLRYCIAINGVYPERS
jgi:microcystin-dependent protein